jgi:hypothetical protein
MERMANSTMHGVSRATGTRYDVSRHASEGGRASGISRRLRPLRQLEDKVLSSSNGAAAYALLRDKRRQHAELERAQLQADELLSQLLDQAQAERNRIEALREVRQRGEAEIEALEQREAELRRQLDSDDGVRTWLELVGEERATAAAVALGWAEDDSDEGDGDVVA